MIFPSKEWFRAAVKALHADAGVQAAARDFGPVTAGAVIEKGGGLGKDFCLFASLDPAREPALQFPDDEDELEEMEPQYLIRAPYPVLKRMLQAALRGERQDDPLGPVLRREVRLSGDLERLVRYSRGHRGVGQGILRAIPTEPV